MAENNEDLVTVKIRREDRGWLKDEQNRLRNAEGIEPSHAVLFKRLRETYEKNGLRSEASVLYHVSIPEIGQLHRDEVRLVALLLSVLRGGQADAIDAVEENVSVFAKYTRLMQDSADPRDGTAARRGAESGTTQKGDRRRNKEDSGEKRPRPRKIGNG